MYMVNTKRKVVTKSPNSQLSPSASISNCGSRQASKNAVVQRNTRDVDVPGGGGGGGKLNVKVKRKGTLFYIASHLPCTHNLHTRIRCPLIQVQTDNT